VWTGLLLDVSLAYWRTLAY